MILRPIGMQKEQKHASHNGYFLKLNISMIKHYHIFTLFLGISSLCWAQLTTPADSLSTPKTKAVTSAQVTDSLKSDSLKTDSTALIKKSSTQTAIKDTVSYEADLIDYDMENKILYLRGAAVINYQNIVLSADSIEYAMDKSIFTATGNPQIVESGDTTVGEKMVYNMKTRRGSVRYASTRMSDAAFNARAIVKDSSNTFYAIDGDYTTCANPENPHYYFYARDVKVLPGDKVIARPAVFNIAEVPIAALPYFMLPLDRSRSSGFLTPSFGGDPSRAYFDNIGYYWAINPYIDLTASTRISQFQDFLANVSSNYALKYWLGGSLNMQYAYNGDFSTGSRQWSLRYNHNQNLSPDGSFKLTGGGQVVNNKNFNKTYSTNTYDLINQSANANLTISKTFSAINASASAGWSRTHNLTRGDLSEDIPNVTFSLPSRPLIPTPAVDPTEEIPKSEPDEIPWYRQIYFNYSAHAIQKHVYNPQNPDTTKINVYNSGFEHSTSLSYNKKLFSYINFAPSVNIRNYVFGSFTPPYPADTAIKARYIYDTLWDREYREQNYDSTIINKITNTFIRLDTLGVLDTQYIFIDSTIWDSTATYPDSNRVTGNYSWNASAALSTTLYGVIPINLFAIKSLRHTISPSVSLTYNPVVGDSTKRYPAIGIGATVNKRASRVAGFSLGNTFECKIAQPKKKGDTSGDEIKPVEKRVQLLTLNASSGYNMDELTYRKWGDISASANNSNPFMGVGVSGAFWVYGLDQKLTTPILNSYSVSFQPQISFSTGGTFWSGDLRDLDITDTTKSDLPSDRQLSWQASVQPSYGFSARRAYIGAPFVTTKNYSLSASARMNFTKQWSLSYSSYYNFVTNQLVGHSVNLACDLECFELRFDWRPSGVNNGYYFLVQLKDIPEIKWEKKP